MANITIWANVYFRDFLLGQYEFDIDEDVEDYEMEIKKMFVGMVNIEVYLQYIKAKVRLNDKMLELNQIFDDDEFLEDILVDAVKSKLLDDIAIEIIDIEA